jgi:hypothetical protein
VSILVLCPSRGRPQNAFEALESFNQTKSRADTRLLFLVDSDDPAQYEYPFSCSAIMDPPPGCMNAAMTAAVKLDWVLSDASIVGFIGDDHRFRTPRWDEAIHAALTAEKGIVYCDDLYQRENLPTMWFLSREIVNVFGMGLPELRHLWIDNYWLTLGEAADCIYYMPDLVIEHMHPYAGKGEMDAGYERANSSQMIDHDRGVFEAWKANSLEADAETLRSIVG